MLTLEEIGHGLTNDIVANVVSQLDFEIRKFESVLIVELFVFGDVMSICWIGGHGDDMNKFESRDCCNEHACCFGDSTGSIGV